MKVYSFPVYWTDKLKIDFLQRVILLHSYLYYEANTSIWSDREFDAVAKQLVAEQSKHTQEWIKNKTQYGSAFYDFDGTTGFDLWYRITDKDRAYLGNIARHMRKDNSR